jgi:glycogen operon protein
MSANVEPVSAGVPEAPGVWTGRPFPLGATWDGAGTNFAVWSGSSTAMTLSLFSADGREIRIPMPERTYDIWHVYLPGIGPGQRYGLRADGPYRPDAGLFHEPTKLLLDPYARAVDGALVDNPGIYPGSGVDSAGFVPRGVVTGSRFDWESDRRLDTPWNDTVIYELHVRGFTKTRPGIPSELRGTYAGLGHPASIDYLTGLGITAVELLPIHAFATEPSIQRRGQVNYWGYNSIGYFAPHSPYASAGLTHGAEVIDEFKAMVRSLHTAGIEVILDVVYNHTAEGPVNGPVVNLRGLDNHGYYRHAYDSTGQYIDYTGCGNTVDARIPGALSMIMDSLRYWVEEMHVDGFRFDLASALARGHLDYDINCAFLAAIAQDPLLRNVKLVAEPWDTGAGGYQVGGFPVRWSEWNGKYRDSVRQFWAHGDQGVRDLAYRLTGSSDLYGDDGRQPWASVNFITAHDGFTLRDLVSYERKHNEANGEGNLDGTNDNLSYNCGSEGETADTQIVTVRQRQARNFLTTLLLSTGVPMLTAGDERWRTQGGNNNAYCLDDETSWLDWSDDATADDLTALTRRLLALRRDSAVLRRRDFFDGSVIPGTDGCKDVAWFDTDATELDDTDWFNPAKRTVGMYLDGRGLRHRGTRNEPLLDDSYLLVLHAGDDTVDFQLPGPPWAAGYQTIVDTTRAAGHPTSDDVQPAGNRLTLPPRSTFLLRVHRNT